MDNMIPYRLCVVNKYELACCTIVEYKFPIHTKKQIRKKQNGRCAMCKRKLIRYTDEFHHKDGNNSNNKASNCEILCSNCHSIKARTKQKRKLLIRW